MDQPRHRLWIPRALLALALGLHVVAQFLPWEIVPMRRTPGGSCATEGAARFVLVDFVSFGREPARVDWLVKFPEPSEGEDPTISEGRQELERLREEAEAEYQRDLALASVPRELRASGFWLASDSTHTSDSTGYLARFDEPVWFAGSLIWLVWPVLMLVAPFLVGTLSKAPALLHTLRWTVLVGAGWLVVHVVRTAVDAAGPGWEGMGTGFRLALCGLGIHLAGLFLIRSGEAGRGISMAGTIARDQGGGR